MGASATSSRATGGTDSTSFNNAGLAGIGFGQDPIEYNSAHVAHEPRHLRAHHRAGRQAVGDDDRVDRSITSRCATRCCRASPPPRCRRCRRGGAEGAGELTVALAQGSGLRAQARASSTSVEGFDLSPEP